MPTLECPLGADCQKGPDGGTWKTQDVDKELAQFLLETHIKYAHQAANQLVGASGSPAQQRPVMSPGDHINVNEGVQGGNFDNCDLHDPVFNIHTSSSRPQKQIEANNIQATWSRYKYRHTPNAAELKRAAELAKEEYLASVEYMQIVDVDISEIPSDHIGKLASIVTNRLNIQNVPNLSQLGAILANVQCKALYLGYMALSDENTLALVTAMRTRVEVLGLHFSVTLDPELLAAYDGRGRCYVLGVVGDTRWWCGARLRRWAWETGWTVTVDTDGLEGLCIERLRWRWDLNV